MGLRNRKEIDELMRLFESMPEDVDRLVRFLSDENMLIREAAARKLRRIDGVPDSVFVDALGNKSVKVRSSAALDLGQRKVRAATPALLDHLASDPSGHVRTVCAMALGDIGGRAALDGLLAALDDKDHHIRHVACQALRRRKNRRAVPQMQSMLSDTDFRVRLCAVRMLVSLRVVDHRLARTAEQLLTDPKFLEAEAGSQESEAEIRAFLDDPEEVGKCAEESGRTAKDTRDHHKWVLRFLQRDREKERAQLEHLVERARQLIAEQNTQEP